MKLKILVSTCSRARHHAQLGEDPALDGVGGWDVGARRGAAWRLVGNRLVAVLVPHAVVGERTDPAAVAPERVEEE